MPKQILVRVNIVGRTATSNGRYALVVKSRVTGVVSERPLTAAEYETSGVNRHALPGEEVLYAYGDHLYDTFTGKLDDGCYCVESAGRVLVKRDANTKQVGVDPALIVNDVLTEAGDAEVTKLAARA